jgi:hypothetical protein
MKSTKKYLTLMLSITFCASFHIFAMEQEKPHVNHEWSGEGPIGEASSSSESGLDERTKEILEGRIRKFEDIDKAINNTLTHNYQEISTELSIELKQLQQHTREILKKTNLMLLGLIPVNIKLVNQEIHSILNRWNKVDSD